MRLTKIQFDTIRRLAYAYRHEWAVGLAFDEQWPTTTRGAWSREMATTTRYCNGEAYTVTDPAELADVELWKKWVELHDRIEAGYVPEIAEIEELSFPLFESECFPSTPWIALRHETCTGRTRWEVCSDGEVRFEFVRAYDESRPRELVCRASSYVLRDGRRVAMVDGFAPLAQWGEHYDRVIRALVDSGCDQSEAKRAVDAVEFGQRSALKFDLVKEHAPKVAA